MIVLHEPSDLDWECLQAIVYHHEPLALAPELLAGIAAGREAFLKLIDAGVPCYGVTTGLGQLVGRELTDAERRDLPHNILRGRAVATGPPLPRVVVRGLMVFRLVNFISGRDGVRPLLCEFLVARLNDDFTPWVPGEGHGMAADAIANCHAFQTFIGEGFVVGPDGERQPAAEALADRGVAPLQLVDKEGLALLNGVTMSPAHALDAHRCTGKVLSLADAVAAVSLEGLAAPHDGHDPALEALPLPPGVKATMAMLRYYRAGSAIAPTILQAPISYRIVPQVHGAVREALVDLRHAITGCLVQFSGNPVRVADEAGGRLLSVGLFHHQQLLQRVENLALAIAHLGNLSERRLHRLLNPVHSGLAPQLASRPGLDAGLVVVHKASLERVARLKHLAQPVSLYSGESSAGQEDYQALMMPAIQRLYIMAEQLQGLLVNELLAGLVALDWRSEQPGERVVALRDLVRQHIPPLTRDRALGPDLECLMALVGTAEFQALLN